MHHSIYLHFAVHRACLAHKKNCSLSGAVQKINATRGVPHALFAACTPAIFYGSGLPPHIDMFYHFGLRGGPAFPHTSSYGMGHPETFC